MSGSGNQYYIKFKESALKGEVEIACVKDSHPLGGPYGSPQRIGPDLDFSTGDIIPGSEDVLPVQVAIQANMDLFVKLAEHCAKSEVIGDVKLMTVRPGTDSKAKPKVMSYIELEDVLIRSIDWDGGDLLHVDMYFLEHEENIYINTKDGKGKNTKIGFDRKKGCRK